MTQGTRSLVGVVLSVSSPPLVWLRHKCGAEDSSERMWKPEGDSTIEDELIIKNQTTQQIKHHMGESADTIHKKDQHLKKVKQKRLRSKL